MGLLFINQYFLWFLLSENISTNTQATQSHTILNWQLLRTITMLSIYLFLHTTILWMISILWKFSAAFIKASGIEFITFQLFSNFIYLFIYLFLTVLALCCCTRAFSGCGGQGLIFIAVHRILTEGASPVVEKGSGEWGFSNCSSRARSCGSWDLEKAQCIRYTGLIASQHLGSSVSGILMHDSALVGRFFTTEQLGKPHLFHFFFPYVLFISFKFFSIFIIHFFKKRSFF